MERKEYKEIIEKLKEGNIDKKFKNYKIKRNKLYYKRKDGKLVKVLQEDEVDSILFMTHNHETGAHFGIENTYNKLVERFYWKNMYRDIKEYIKFCDACQRRGKKGGTGLLNPIKIGEPFGRIGIDFVGPLSKTKREISTY